MSALLNSGHSNIAKIINPIGRLRPEAVIISRARQLANAANFLASSKKLTQDDSLDSITLLIAITKSGL